MDALLIGEVSRRTGVAAPTIRYYERLGLLPAPQRSASGYRRYSESTVEALAFIRKAQALGFSLDEIAEVLKLTRAGQRPCARVLSLGREHLAAVEARIRQLQTFRDQLAAELTKWDTTATGNSGPCPFIARANVTGTTAPVARHVDGPKRARRFRA